jgi:hypothetical protein
MRDYEPLSVETYGSVEEITEMTVDDGYGNHDK